MNRQLAALDAEAIEVFSPPGEGILPKRSASWFAWSRTRKAAAQTAADPPATGGDFGLPKVRDSEIRDWLVAALRQLDSGSDARTLRMVDEQGAPSEHISIEQPLTNGPATLRVRGVEVTSHVPGKVALLDLGEIERPQLEIHILSCAVDRVSIANSKLKGVLIQDVTCVNRAGAILYANGAEVGGGISVVGSGLPTLFSDFEAVSGSYPRKLKNCFSRIDATGLKCAQLTVWNIALNGPHYLKWLHDTGAKAFPGLYRGYSKGLVLHGAKLNRLLAYQCQFHGPVTLRFATVDSQVKFEACYFQGYNLPLKYFAKREIRDEFDDDDFRPLNGMVLDASRATLGRELVFRQIDPHLREGPKRNAPRSSGWMNWSHATTETLNDDMTLWQHQDGRRWRRNDEPPMRFRLNGFCYENLAVGHLMAAPSDSAKPLQAAGSGVDQEEPPQNLEPLPEKKTTTTRGDERAAQRISWLYCQLGADLCEEFMAQPWTQCGHAFLTAGNRSQANRLFQERESLWHRSLRYRHSDSPTERVRAWALYVWHSLVSWLPGYGYRMWAPFAVGVAIWLLGWVVFTAAFSGGFMMQNPDAANGMHAGPAARPLNQQYQQDRAALRPTGIADRADQISPKATTASAAVSQGMIAGVRTSADLDWRDRYASPYPLMYSLDLLVPVIEFGQANYWIPGENREQQALSGALNWTPEEREGYLGWVWVWYWVQIAMGWYLSTVIVTSLAGLFEREH